MNKEKLSEVLNLHEDYLNGITGGERADLRSADLSSANLSYANLRSADLRYADLRYADLRSADLRYADLSYADLRYADLRYADLRSADLSSARNVKYAQCSWYDHGECGRQLLAVIAKKEIIFYCGCFMGTEKELRTFINNGEDKHKKSRRKAMNFLLSCLKDSPPH